MSYIDSALNIINWLKLATDNTTDGKRVKERYMMNSNAWKVLYRPDCNIETAYAFLKYWEYTKDDSYLQLSRDIYDSIVKLQRADGSFPFANAEDFYTYTNDNSEVPIFLFRMAEIDLERANVYIATALKGSDFILSIQNSDGSWRVVDNDTTKTPMFVAHAVSCLSTAYRYTSNKAEYKSAIERGLDWIINNNYILDTGRVRCCWEINNATEYWRPPSSDESITIRGFAHAELYVTDSEKRELWKINRHKMLEWLNQCIDESGAVKNGLGDVNNGADLPQLTDHVYTTAFAVEAYLYSAYVDNKQEYLDTATKIVNFSANNLYYSDEAETNGIIRGAYNLRDKNWDTSELILNAGQEGGANMIYSGWVNAPLACHFIDFEKRTTIDNVSICFQYNSEIINIPLLKDKPKESHLGVFINNEIRYIKLVDTNNINASNIRVFINNKIKALARN